MLSDKELLIQLFEKRNIKFERFPAESYYSPEELSRGLGHANETIITVDGGYPGFFTQFTFKDGTLLSIGAYE